MAYDYAFEMVASNIRYGPGTTREVGMDLAELGLRRIMILTDANLGRLPPVEKVLESLSSEKIAYSLFDQVRVEPTGDSRNKLHANSESSRPRSSSASDIAVQISTETATLDRLSC